MSDMNYSPFRQYLKSLQGRNVYFDKMTGNNGDRLITMGAEHLFAKLDITTVPSPQYADCIIVNGGNTNGMWRGRVEKLGYYRRTYPATMLVVAPSSFRFRGIDFKHLCDVKNPTPFILFARERYSYQVLTELSMPPHVECHLSQDLAFELAGSSFIHRLSELASEDHLLVAMRRDKEGPAGILTKTHAPWLPGVVRKPLSRLRDRLAASISHNMLEDIVANEQIEGSLPRIYRDVSEAVSFDEFVSTIAKSKNVITDRLHTAILGFLLEKRIALICREDHKTRGVFEFSMSGPHSNTVSYTS